jgi:hypothetical protein
MSILIVGSILSVFILLVYLSEVHDSDGMNFIGWFGIIFTVIFGGGYTVLGTKSEEIVPVAKVIVTKSPYRVYVDWTNYEGVDMTTKFENHKEYSEIDSNSVWKATISTNAWGYDWCDSGDIFYENK